MFMPPALRGHEHGQAGGAVDDDAEVELAGDVAAGFDEDAADGLAFGAGLDRDELVVEQIPGDCGGVFGGLRRVGRRVACGLSLIVPLPRPPAWIWAFTTASGPPSCLNAAEASSAVVATMPCGTATPASRRSCLALVFVDLHGYSMWRRVNLTVKLHAEARGAVRHQIREKSVSSSRLAPCVNSYASMIEAVEYERPAENGQPAMRLILLLMLVLVTLRAARSADDRVAGCGARDDVSHQVCCAGEGF